MRRRHFRFFFAVAWIACVSSCGDGSAGKDPEDRLLAAFQQELDTLVLYQDRPYHEYLAHQHHLFKKKVAATVPLIESINKKFNALSPHEKLNYEIHWQHKFQPVINDIDHWTKKLASRETADLTTENMTKIEALMLKMKLAEKEAPGIKLLPVFFRQP